MAKQETRPMSVTHPDLAAEFHPSKNGDHSPQKLTGGTNFRLWWKCTTISEKPCGHEWRTSGANRTRVKSGCPVCAGKALHIDGRNSMRNTSPKLTADFHPTKNHPKTPDNILAGHSKKLWWRCSVCANEWETPGTVRLNQKSGCGYCESGYLHSDRRNSLAKKSAKLSSDFHPTKNGDLTPLDVVAGGGKRVWWLCSVCNHEWPARVVDRFDLEKASLNL